MNPQEIQAGPARRGPPARLLLLVSAVAVFLVLLVNLSWLDEPLLPQLEALRQPRPVSPAENGYPLALGFLAAESRDPRAAGDEIIARLREHRDQGKPASLGKEQLRGMLGSPPPDEGLQKTLGFHCQARHHVDCAERLVARLASVDLNSPRLAVLMNRYETLLRQSHFVETPEPDLQTPLPPYGPIVALGRLRLAMSLQSDPTPVFLAKVSQDLTFWRMTLREGEALSTKMVALAAIRNAHDFVSAVMRERKLDSQDLELLRGIVRPFTREERDIGAAFVSEARAFLLSGVTPASQDSSWVTRVLLQKNATFNLYFDRTIEPMRMRASLDARAYFETRAHEPLRHTLLTPGFIYNLGGKWALNNSPWDPHQFPSRVHDENGRIVLLLLQAQVEQHPELDVETLVRNSAHRNPYTGLAMEYDAQAAKIGFACLHTAFHPPEPGDQCAVALGRNAT